MSTVDERLARLREEREARQKLRIEKLREMNMKRYCKLGNPSLSQPDKPQGNPSSQNTQKHPIQSVKKPFPIDSKVKSSVPSITTKIPKATNIKLNSKVEISNDNFNKKEKNELANKQSVKVIEKPKLEAAKKINQNVFLNKPTMQKQNGGHLVKKDAQNTTAQKSRVSISLSKMPIRRDIKDGPKLSAGHRESVFDRLYKPKAILKKEENNVEKIKSDPNYLKKVMKDAGLILNKRHTLGEVRVKETLPVRRSISAVHFKRISKSEMDKCIHKWASIGDKIDKVDLQTISEDNAVKEDKLVLAVKSERKKVKFQTPTHNFNTPKPRELQERLQSWLQKRGKALTSFHHLQCFGLDYLEKPKVNESNVISNFSGEMKTNNVNCGEVTGYNVDCSEVTRDNAIEFNEEDENKENIEVELDSDNESYLDNMNNKPSEDVNKEAIMKDFPPKLSTPMIHWRQASLINESGDLNDTKNTSLMSGDVVSNCDEVLLGALNDLTQLLKEGFEWEQCARWLRAIRERFPQATNTAAYWECRAQLEERRGDLPASVACWEEAIVKGTQHSVVEASLDQLLDKFMQLKISPNSGKGRQVDSKLVDVKNVFKSTIIRFAVQQARIRQSECPKYTVTPVRRSARLSAQWSGKRTPLQDCTSVRQADERLGQKLLFLPNDTISATP